MKRLTAALAALALPTAFSATALAQQPPDPTAPAPTQPAPPSDPSAQPSAPAPTQPAQPSEQEIREFEKKLMGQFEGADNYKITGTVAQIDQNGNAMILTRGELPPVLLVTPETVPVKIDGQKATVDDIQVGTEVRATFNIAQNYPIALQLEAKKPKEGAKPEQQKAPAKKK